MAGIMKNNNGIAQMLNLVCLNNDSIIPANNPSAKEW